MIVIQILVFLVLLYGVGGLVVKFLKLPKRDRGGNPLGGQFLEAPFWKQALMVGAPLWIITLLIVQIDGQRVGVVVKPGGVSENELTPGWNVVAPWNKVYEMDKTVWVYTCAHASAEGTKPKADAIWAPTKDGIKMGFDVSVSWKIDPDQASWIYANVTDNDGLPEGRYIWLEENVIRTKLKSALTTVVSKYSTVEAYSTKKEEIQKHIDDLIKKECLQYRIIVDNTDLREVFYDDEYGRKIRDTKLAEQEVATLVNVTRQKDEQLKQAMVDKNIAIEKATGEAEALKIKGSSIASNPKIIDLEWINKWDGSLPTYMMGSGQGIMLNLNK